MRVFTNWYSPNAQWFVCSRRLKNTRSVCILVSGGVEDTRIEAKDTNKIQGQGQPFRGQTLSRPRTRMLEAKAKDTSASTLQKKDKNFSGDLQKKTSSKNFLGAPPNFNNSKNSAVLKPRTGQFSRTWGFEAKAKDLTFEAKAKDFKTCPRGRLRGEGRPLGLHLWFLY